MKKSVFREFYYKGIEATGDNFGNKKIIKNKTKSINIKDDKNTKTKKVK